MCVPRVNRLYGMPSRSVEVAVARLVAESRRNTLSALAACLSLACVAAPLLAQGTPAAPAKPASTGAAAPAAAPVVDEAARRVAATVQAFYDQTHDVTASFFQTYVNKLYDRTDRSSGRVVFKKPGRMRWDYVKPNGKVIVAGGGKLVVYEPGDEGEAGQVLEQGFKDSDLPQAMAFLMGGGRLADDFTFRLLDASKEGFPSGEVLELTPKKPSPHFERLFFYVESAPALRGLVRRLLIVDASGNRNRFDFSELKFNAAVPEATFDWKPPANARRVNL